MKPYAQNKKFQGIVEYGLIIALYYVTGSAFSYNDYSGMITTFFVVAVGIGIITGRLNKSLTGYAVLILIVMSIFLLIPSMQNTAELSSYIAIILQLAIGMCCAAIIPIEHFKERYVRVMVFFALISLIGFGIGFAYPQFAHNFPVSTTYGSSVYYYNAHIYVFMQPKGYANTVMTMRNAGICWEPGCYQMFLNVALYLLLSDKNALKNEIFIPCFVILVITILTTGSTLGLILLACTLILFRGVWLQGLSKKMTLVFFIILLIPIIIWLLSEMEFMDSITEKFQKEFQGGGAEGGWMDRISLNRISYLLKDGLWFFGMPFSRYVEYGESIWNSVIHSMICCGIPFTVMQLHLYWKGSKKLADGKIFLFIIMLLSAMTETLFWRVFFNTCAFYGIIEKERKKEEGINR